MSSNKTVFSFAITLALWWLLLGSVYMALGFLALVFVHEMGHYFAAKQKKIAVTTPVFTPLGAFIGLLEMPKRADDEAYMAYGGPLLGTIGAVATLIMGVVLGVPDMITLARYAFVLNLFNLIPLAPLDGGRISMAIDRRMWILGVPMFIYVIWSSGFSMFTMMIAVLIGMQAFQDIQGRKLLAEANPGYFDVGFKVKVAYAVAYLALGGFLFYAITNISGLVRLLSLVF